MADEITPVVEEEIQNQSTHEEQQHHISGNVEPTGDSSTSVIDHLVVMVHGMKGSEREWMYVTEQLAKEFPEKVFVYGSKQNEHNWTHKRTYDGVDVMGERLANEVIEVIQRNPSMRKISFIAYSVGGLVARYAIGRLYSAPENEADSVGTICGLSAMNFITLATPHLGSSGHWQVPILMGRTILEKIARRVAPWIVGKTGRQLFLTDGTERTHPLLLRMVDDSDGCYFRSALRAFERRVVYSNVIRDYIVGWRTASIRGDRENVKLKRNLNEKYPHVVHEEDCQAREQTGSHNIHDEMVRGLSCMSWQKVDIIYNFGCLIKYQAHSIIQVKHKSKHIKGADVIQHVIDNFLI